MYVVIVEIEKTENNMFNLESSDIIAVKRSMIEEITHYLARAFNIV